ncbi:MAG: recombinase family protein [Myxococcaceae bacterium]|nr:recombinase family protein [Myxococcaceae bacterium]
MSTEHQQYSTENQADVLREYATRRGLEIVRTFTDSGKSGLRIDGRNGLKDLIDVVQSGAADFKAILVYDVSRWGRFQDADESAYYEYICKRAGINVQYCAEQFENDGSPVSTIVKGVKRAMAGEYSRELSAKVFKGQCKLVELGFRQGGAAGFGLRRLLIDQAGKPKTELRPLEQKSLQTDRVVLVPGPTEERAVVRRIYRLFVHEGRSEGAIADELNRSGILAEAGRTWTRGMVQQVLTNEKYIGNNVYNRVSFKLKKKRVHNPPDMWVRRDGAFEAIVDVADFVAAQAIIVERHKRATDSELLEKLRALANHRGALSGLIIDEAEGMPSSATYRHRFGSLARAYQLIDYAPDRDLAFLETNQRLRQLHPEIVAQVAASLEAQGGAIERDPETELITVNGMLVISVVIARCQTTLTDAMRWTVRLEEGLQPDLTIAVRMDAPNRAPLDYYVLPSLDVTSTRLRIKEDNGIFLDGYRFDSLDYVYGMAQTVRAGVAA